MVDSINPLREKTYCKGAVVVDLIHLSIGMAGVLLGFVLRLLWSKILENEAQNDAASIIRNAKKEADRHLKECELAAQSEIFKKKEAFESEMTAIRKELRTVEKRLLQKEESLNERSLQLEKRDQQLAQLKEHLDADSQKIQMRTEEIEKIIDLQKRTLHEISGLTKEQATDILLKKIETQLENDVAHLIEKTIARAKNDALLKARDILALAVQRCAVEHTADNVVSTIDIPNDEMKGRIIGREGRNIRIFEKSTGIDVIVDDTPGVVVVSGFNAIRREIARRAMEKLILDGRIHPARIEEIVEDTKKEMSTSILESGNQAAYDANVNNLHPTEIELVGRMKFHVVSGQNLLQHTMEVVELSAILASELGLDVQIARRCALLHDIGRVCDGPQDGTHAQVGADIAKRCKEHPDVVNSIAAHHEQVASNSLFSIILQIAHTLCLDRPGARKIALERHLKRLQRLEDIALSMEGIETAYAIQSGREVRCIANTKNIEDSSAILLARKLAQKIEEDMTYPGEIKVTVVRETRIIEYAK